jgi:hypothetical protein
MTNNEAIEFLKYAVKNPNPNGNLTDEHTQIVLQVINLAIKALEENDRLKSDIDGLNNQMDDLCENLAWYINERNRLMAKLKEADMGVEQNDK